MRPATFVRSSTIVVLLHAAVMLPHGLAHVGEHAQLSPAGNVFVALVIGAAPFVALLLQYAGARRVGALLLFSSMLGALAFGIISHYLVPGSDHVGLVPAGAWRLPFQVTAALLVGTEAAGAALGGWGVVTLRRPRVVPQSIIHPQR